VAGTNVYAGGYFTDAGGDPNADYIAAGLDRRAWHPRRRLNNPVLAIAWPGRTSTPAATSPTPATTPPPTASPLEARPDDYWSWMRAAADGSRFRERESSGAVEALPGGLAAPTTFSNPYALHFDGVNDAVAVADDGVHLFFRGAWIKADAWCTEFGGAPSWQGQLVARLPGFVLRAGMAGA